MAGARVVNGDDVKRLLDLGRRDSAEQVTVVATTGKEEVVSILRRSSPPRSALNPFLPILTSFLRDPLELARVIRMNVRVL